MQRNRNIEALKVLKLELLRNFLMTHPDLTDDLKNEIAKTTSVGEIWSFLFKHDLFNLYEDLSFQGIVPTSAELNEIHNLESAWYWLAVKDKGRTIFLDLLTHKGLLPEASLLSVVSKTDMTNAWYGLTRSDVGAPIFEILFNKSIYPNSADLSVVSKPDNTNGWYELIRSDAFIGTLRNLFNKSIYPSSADLSVVSTTDNTNGWYWLTESNRRAQIFQELLDLSNKNIWILPKSADLAVVCSTNNTNAWYWLAGTNVRAEIFEHLLHKNILPKSADLSLVSATNNTNAWYWLAGKHERARIFQALLNKDIWPTRDDLSLISATDKTNAWYWLAGSHKRAKIFERLLKKDILPKSADLSVICDTNNTNAWYWLAQSCISTFQTLLDKDIWPTRAQLFILSNENKSPWFWLAQSNAGHSVILKLVSNDILPIAAENNKLISLTSLFNEAIPEAVSIRLQNLEALNNKYNLNPQNQMSILLSREDIKNFYGFLYWIYSSEHLPIDLLNLVGTYLLPNSVSNFNFIDLKKLLPTELLPKWYDLVLVSSFADLNEELDVKLDTIYLSKDGKYIVRDPNGNVQIGLLDQKKIDLSQLEIKFNDAQLKYELKKAILPVIADAGHITFDTFKTKEDRNTFLRNYSHQKSEENRNTFLKHYMINRLNTYLGKYGIFRVPHLNRVESLRDAITNSESPGPILINQYFMSRRGGQASNETCYARKTRFYHQQPFGGDIRKEFFGEDFNNILKEGYALYKIRGQYYKK